MFVSLVLIIHALQLVSCQPNTINEETYMKFEGYAANANMSVYLVTSSKLSSLATCLAQCNRVNACVSIMFTKNDITPCSLYKRRMVINADTVTSVSSTVVNKAPGESLFLVK